MEAENEIFDDENIIFSFLEARSHSRLLGIGVASKRRPHLDTYFMVNDKICEKPSSSSLPQTHTRELLCVVC